MSSMILIPLDGSELAEGALSCAAMLAHGLPAELILLRAVSLSPDVREVLDKDGLETDVPLGRLEAEAHDYLCRVASRFEGHDLHVRPVVRRGPAAEVIVDSADQMAVQMIVMATHGYSGFSRWKHGSVAERVLQAASVPVLLVRAGEERVAGPEPETIKTCRRILVPLDGSPMAEQVLPPVSSVARALDARLVLFRAPIVYTSGAMVGEWYLPLEGVLEVTEQDAQVYLAHMAERLAEEGLKVSTAMQRGGVAEAIVDYAEANQMDLIAMCTHGRTGLARWMLGSVADRVLRAGGVPLFLVRSRE